ncbi:DUF302 domain-containing protein [Nocardia cyriacigeorgica]|uniref:DUF302 domain-containing protein n=1 Tax=Nocardia cyriacigeorgica TaxID=135487 RepID=UPI002455D43F|nr:DUF302 domain-containing protein [Nocardia cyriacigeorgica]
MRPALTATLHTGFDEAVTRTRDALAQQGFGVLTEIDMRATLKDKLGAEIEDYRILGACNPPLAHRAVTADRRIGLLLPCNVVVRRDPGADSTVIVEAMDPDVMVQVTDNPAALRPIAASAEAKLRAALDSLDEGAASG